jgi:hypothetical protein
MISVAVRTRNTTFSAPWRSIVERSAVIAPAPCVRAMTVIPAAVRASMPSGSWFIVQ